MLKKRNFIIVVVAVTFCWAMISPAQAETELTMYYPVAFGGPLTKIVDGMVADFMKENRDCLLYTSDAADDFAVV